MSPPPSPEQFAAAATLTQTARHMAPASLSFLNGILTLTGAAVALLISQANVLLGLVSPAAMKYGLAVLIFSGLFGLMAKYNASIVEMALRLESEGEQFGKALEARLASQGVTELDTQKYEDEVLRGLFWPTKILVARSFAKNRRGDYTAQARTVAKLSQATGLLVLLQFLCVAIGPLIMVVGIRG